METHKLERENVLRLADKDTTDTCAILEELNNSLNFAHIQLYVSAERKVEESPVGKMANPLLQKVEHLGAQRF
jgi:hypothetical protein